MKIEDWYLNNFEQHLKGRYITLESISHLLKGYQKEFKISFPATSELGVKIPLLKVGNGSKVILGWSQMHGNESTTTKALFDFLKFISQKEFFQSEIEKFHKNYSFYLIPILNPDGAKLYTRENANSIDLNRDAQNLSQKESQCLREVFDKLNPSICLNFHDQRSIYGFENGNPATISFLSPAADKQRSITDARKNAMEYIVKMNACLQKHIPGQVGRYDDSFNDACVGDTFQMAGISTILFEAGHFENDYEREKSREFIFYSILSLFDIFGNERVSYNYKEYLELPENKKNYYDFILRNAKINGENSSVSIAIQYSETLKNEVIEFVPMIEKIGNLEHSFGHRELDLKGAQVLTIPQENLTEGTHISIIFDKYDKTTIYFQ